MPGASYTGYNIICGESKASLEVVKFEVIFWIAVSPKQYIRVILALIFVSENIPDSTEHLCYITTEQWSRSQSPSDEKVRKPSHCLYQYCTYGLETVCLAVIIGSLASLNAGLFWHGASLINTTCHGKTELA